MGDTVILILLDNLPTNNCFIENVNKALTLKIESNFLSLQYSNWNSKIQEYKCYDK